MLAHQKLRVDYPLMLAPIIVSTDYWKFLSLCTRASSKLRRRNLKTEVSLWKCIKCSPSILRRRNLKTQHHRSFWICVWGELGQGHHVIIVTSLFSKSSVLKMSSLCIQRQSRHFQISPVEERFRKAPFSSRISVDGRPKRRKKKVRF